LGGYVLRDGYLATYTHGKSGDDQQFSCHRGRMGW
jgi:hypothetical protein